MDVLTAPEHLRGKIDRWSPQSLKEERLEWIRANKDAARGDVAKALGVAQPALSRLRRKAGIEKKPPRREGIDERGIKAGSVMPAVLAMPPEAQDALEARAAKTGQTLAQVLAEAWVEGMT